MNNAYEQDEDASQFEAMTRQRAKDTGWLSAWTRPKQTSGIMPQSELVKVLETRARARAERIMLELMENRGWIKQH
jgi:hypothetical protein